MKPYTEEDVTGVKEYEINNTEKTGQLNHEKDSADTDAGFATSEETRVGKKKHNYGNYMIAYEFHSWIKKMKNFKTPAVKILTKSFYNLN